MIVFILPIFAKWIPALLLFGNIGAGIFVHVVYKFDWIGFMINENS